MTFSEYRQTAYFQKSMAKAGFEKRRWRYDLIICAVLVAYTVSILLLSRLTSEEQKEQPWFLPVVIALSAVYFAALVVDFVLGLKYRQSRGNMIPPECGVGLLLYMREQNISPRGMAHGGILEYPVTLPECAGDIPWVRVGDETVDLSLFGLDDIPAAAAALLPLVEFIVKSDLSSMNIHAVCALAYYLGPEYGATPKQGGKPFVLVKRGRWTLSGKMLLHDYKKILRLMKKQGAGV